jgi:hypothetical protein
MSAMPDWFEVLLAVAIAAVVFVPLLIGLVLVIRDTARGSGRWGINTNAVRCPRCDEPAPTVRVPANWRQALWGGHTCRECGCEYDKWGKPIDLGEGIDRSPFRRRLPPADPRPDDDRVRRQSHDVRNPADPPPAGDDHV